MLVPGARGSTLESIAKGLGASSQELNKGIEVLCKIDAYSKSGKETDLTTALSVWYHHSLTLKSEYVTVLQHPLNAAFGPISAANINNFINANTQGKVQSRLSEEEVASLRLALVSCLYFKAL